MPNDEDQNQNRRSSDSLLMKMAQDLGTLTGTVATFIDGQEKINKQLADLHDKQDTRAKDIEDRTTKLETFKTRVVTIIATTGIGGTSLGAWLAKTFHLGGGGS